MATMATTNAPCRPISTHSEDRIDAFGSRSFIPPGVEAEDRNVSHARATKLVPVDRSERDDGSDKASDGDEGARRAMKCGNRQRSTFHARRTLMPRTTKGSVCEGELVGGTGRGAVAVEPEGRGVYSALGDADRGVSIVLSPRREKADMSAEVVMAKRAQPRVSVASMRTAAGAEGHDDELDSERPSSRPSSLPTEPPDPRPERWSNNTVNSVATSASATSVHVLVWLAANGRYPARPVTADWPVNDRASFQLSPCALTPVV